MSIDSTLATETESDKRTVGLDLGFDQHSPAVMRDPYPLYREMQSKCPVSYANRYGGFWIVSTYDLARDAANDYRTFTSTKGAGIPVSPNTPLYPIHIDPPLQTAFRKLLNPRFTPEALEKWRTPFVAEVHRLIDGFIAAGQVNLAHDLCQPAPLSAVLPLIGIPRDRIDELRPLVAQVIRGRAEIEKAAAAGRRIEECLLEVIAERRSQAPQDDVLGDLLGAEIMGAPLSDDAIFRTLAIILFGGLDTTTAAMLEGVRHLAAHPEDLLRLQKNPELWPVAIEEIVRFTSPAQAMSRTTTRDVQIGSHQLHEDEKVMILFGAANRDPAVFERPDEIVLDRCPNEHMGFGRGAHVCLGRNLARLEVGEILRAIFERMPDLKVAVSDKELDYHISEARGLKELPAIFTPGVPRG